jgi:hypothetical protein
LGPPLLTYTGSDACLARGMCLGLCHNKYYTVWIRRKHVCKVMYIYFSSI